MTRPDWDNAIAATPTGPFFEDLAVAVTNDGDADGAVRWLLGLLGGDDPWRAWDTYIDFFAGLDRAWTVMRIAAEMFGSDTAQLARFVAERIKAATDEDIALPHMGKDGRINFGWFHPRTCGLVVCDRAHDLAAFFSIGLKPNGSKDPYALRRAAKHFIIAAALLPKRAES